MMARGAANSHTARASEGAVRESVSEREVGSEARIAVQPFDSGGQR